MTIYMPPDPSGWGPALSGGINKFAEVYSRLQEQERLKKEKANEFLLNALMQYGGTISPEQMGQIEQSMGMVPRQGIGSKIQDFIRGGTPSEVYGPESIIAQGQPPQPTSPLRSLFEQIPEGGFKIKGQAERGLETFKKQKEIEEPFEITKEERGLKKQKELIKFQTDEEIKGKLKEIETLSGLQRTKAIADLEVSLQTQHDFRVKAFSSELDMMEKEAKVKGDLATTQAIEKLKQELPLQWEQRQKEIKLMGEEARKEEQIKLGREVAKEDVAAAKERKRDYERTKALLKVTKPMKLEGEEVTEGELEEIRRIVTMQGFDIETVPISKKTLGVDWIAKDKFTFRIVDPETGVPPKIYGEKETKKPTIPQTGVKAITEELRKKYGY